MTRARAHWGRRYNLVYILDYHPTLRTSRSELTSVRVQDKD